MNTETRLNKIESAVQTIPRTAEQLLNEWHRLPMSEQGRWLTSLSDEELDSLVDPDEPEYEPLPLDQLTDEELEAVIDGDERPLERLRNQKGQA